jgi:hypothetical protein
MANIFDILRQRKGGGMNPDIESLRGMARGRLDTVGANADAELKDDESARDAAIIGERQIKEAAETLKKYKDGKSNYDRTIIENEQWYKLRHWEYIRRNPGKNGDPNRGIEPTSAYLFNVIMNKHADAMDNYPDPVVLPRESGDVNTAKTLSDVLPVILDRNNFKSVYSDNWWEKLKHGTAIYGVFWNHEKENGLGDIDIKAIDLLKIYWEPGKTEIQDSKNLFIIELADADDLAATFPGADKKKFGQSITVAEYIHDENIKTSDKVLVVDWYYKKRVGGRVVLHYVKFCGAALLYATENDPELRERGLYDHGLYPVVVDRMFPEKDAPIGFGEISIAKDPQMYIDKLMGNVLETSMLNTKRRYFASKGVNIDVKQLLDNSQPVVEVEGSINNLADKLVEMKPRELSGIYPNIAQMKVDEIKDTTGNREVNSGGTGGGVTAASAVALLQESGNKTSRDAIDASYRTYVKLNTFCIELIRQFYDESRSFRITGAPEAPQGMPMGAPNAMGQGMPMEMQNGAPAQNMGVPQRDNYHFVNFNNKGLRDQVTGVDSQGNQMFRHPVFDLQIKAQKKNPFSKEAQNQLAIELFRMGAFNPQMADAALTALSLMDFEGIEEVRERVQQGQTLYGMVQELQARLAQMQAMMDAASKKDGGSV